MKAAVFTGLATGLVLRELPDPVPGPGEVLLRVRRTGICGSELHYTADTRRAVPPDHVLGHEVCGEVVALGEGVSRYRPGDRDFEVVAATLAAEKTAARSMITGCVGFDALPARFESLRGPSADCKVLIDPSA